ncbi:2-dehydro-3-deoxy-6-phosphogalactonate aldolase [Robbsia andropogonis]|uniref:2-dehydro-3-deoxy-6-phosphogalactonate aldolase n=1 Tax=Robbsia andropogonis TaxID=28092 RepID=A0A0F5JUC4_9BURK|nr:2-dehydro-3-deoxy-6-phosphogalactonate aldolase [Robbsia andropogonis]KKB61448.1 2-dehydro-3-deoxy-6-phosphogalactonate aldolase [Robbsia andropogonis]MCP1121054.1 2-dehydro-3-deoxy-6-phosphogalactonate aldolase [Robbsia andropogonis]MCP1130847.1 2-dehydro-3-deoxy-6-phosphogalactonate aldolase [Robbsia andropogonis]
MTLHSTHPMLDRAMQACGMVAILRGVRPDEVVDIGQSLYEAGFRIIEVPLNSPEPLRSITALRQALPDEVMVGAGTVLSPDDVAKIAQAGGQIIVMPHSDTAVIRAARDAGLAVAPGVATPTEAFAALAAGAHVLKMFPAELLGPAVVKAWRAVIPKSVPLLPVGGITPDNMTSFLEAGAQGFGLGSALYKPGLDAAEVGQRAHRFMTAWRTTQPAV